jgi:hypothetical protein
MYNTTAFIKQKIHTENVTCVSKRDILFAARSGYTVLQHFHRLCQLQETFFPCGKKALISLC